MRCVMKKVCYKNLGEGGRRGLAQTCKDKTCILFHEKRTCETEALGMKECEYLTSSNNDKDRSMHMRSSVHKADVGNPEWSIRSAVMALREAHGQDIYTGQV